MEQKKKFMRTKSWLRSFFCLIWCWFFCHISKSTETRGTAYLRGEQRNLKICNCRQEWKCVCLSVCTFSPDKYLVLADDDGLISESMAARVPKPLQREFQLLASSGKSTQNQAFAWVNFCQTSKKLRFVIYLLAFASTVAVVEKWWLSKNDYYSISISISFQSNAKMSKLLSNDWRFKDPPPIIYYLVSTVSRFLEKCPFVYNSKSFKL